MRRFILGWQLLGHQQRLKAHIVNYADDFVICCRGSAEEAMRVMRSIMKALKLTVNEQKTGVCTLPEGRFDVGFPGYLRSQDVNGKNILLDDLYAPFRKFSSRRTFESRLMPASTITSRCGRNRWYSVS